MKILKLFFVLFFGLSSVLLQAQNFENPYDYIGQNHNEAMKYLLENLDKVPEKAKIKSTIIQILSKKYNDKDFISTMNEFPNTPTNEELLSLSREKVDSKLFAEINDVSEIILKGSALPELLKILEEKESNASKNLRGDDLNLYYMFIAGAKYSSIFWLPESQGGENGIKYFKGGSGKGSSGKQSLDTKIETKFNSILVSWYKVILADALGAVVGGASTLNPVGATAGLVMGSGQNIIGQL